MSKLTGDEKYREQAIRTIVDGIKKTKNWNNLEQGRITEGQDGDPTQGNDGRQFKAIYVRALTEAARREWQNADLHKLIKAYLNINVSSLSELLLATMSNSLATNSTSPLLTTQLMAMATTASSGPVRSTARTCPAR